jgi:hypothetical protein
VKVSSVSIEIMSPLAKYFDGHATPKKPLRVRSVIIASAFALSMIPIAGTVLAADITTGTQDFEFGQGSLATRECDDVVTIALTTGWYSAGSYFRLTQIDLGDVNLTNCNGKTLTVSAYSSSGTQLDLSSGTGSSLAYAVRSATVTSPVTGTSSSATIPLSVDGLVNSVDVDKVTVETATTAG